ncbi:MAG: choice-of-anchor J domain-containing protein [Muribaculaceae bacterium]|nr:choice-of-anchor J domain-containing protein [Muribaculaceae bacterium]
MKSLIKYFYSVVALAAVSVLPACQDHFDTPDLEQVPVATMTPNTTIAEFKEMMWSESNNYCDAVPVKDEEGTHIIISGRVVSSDYAGNCFKYIVLQDETGALNFSINSYNLYLTYRRGQEIVVDLTELYAGKYRGLEQVGFPSFNSSINGDETSFMAPELFSSHAQLNGRPNLAAVDTIQIDRFSELGTSPAELRRWQSQLVKFNNVEFVPNETLPTLSTYHSSGETQQIKDAEGNTMDIRTSGYANFWNMELPEGRGDVVAILGYYVNLAGTGGWQLTLLDANSLMNFGNPTVPQGNQGNPYSVQQAIAFEENSENQSGWVKGYIVGTVAPEIETVSSDEDIEWTATPTLGNTLVIGQSADTRSISECLVVALPQGSDLRQYGALRENPGNYGKWINIRGTFAKVMGTYGLTGNNGSSANFEIEDFEAPSTEGDGSEEKPYNCAQVINMNPTATDVAVESGIWVKGYIVGYYFEYAGHFDATGTQAANILMSDNPEANNTAQCICVQLVAKTDVRAALNLVDNPGVLGAVAAVKGDVMKYNTLPGIKNTSEYKLDSSVTPNPPTPPTPPVGDNTVTLLGQKDADGGAGWTFDNVTLPSGLTAVWAWKEYNSAYYLNGSAYANNAAQAAESYAVSPVIDLSASTTASVEFSHAAKFQTTLRDLCGFYAREAGTTTWVKLNIPTWPEAGAWTFASSGSIDLSAFAGKKVQVGFKYGSTSAGADTWEIRDLVLTSDGAITVEGGGNSGNDDPVNPPTPPTPPTPPVGTEGDGTFNFADPSTLQGAFSLSDEVADGTTGNTKIEVKDVTFYSGQAALVNSGDGTGARLYHQSSGAWSFRFYKKTATTISVAEGYHIVSVKFTTQTAAHKTALAACTFSSGTFSDNVWTASGNSTTTLTITDTDAGTVGLTAVEVTYAQ